MFVSYLYAEPGKLWHYGNTRYLIEIIVEYNQVGKIHHSTYYVSINAYNFLRVYVMITNFSFLTLLVKNRQLENALQVAISTKKICLKYRFLSYYNSSWRFLNKRLISVNYSLRDWNLCKNVQVQVNDLTYAIKIKRLNF